MTWPSWERFVLGLREFEQNLSDSETNGIEYIKKFKEKHPILDGVVHGAISCIPPPISEIISGMYNKSRDPESGAIEIYTYLKNLEQLQREHYTQVITNLEAIKTNMATEKTQILIKDALLSSGELLKKKIGLLFELETKVDTIKEDTEQIKKKLISEKKSGFEGFAEQIDESIQKINALIQTYVKPKEYDKILQALNERKVSIITGSPEYGKTYTAYHILLEYYNKDFVPYHIRIRDNPKNISNELKFISKKLYENEKIAVYLDDPFGQTEFNNLDKSALNEIRDLIAEFNKNQNGSILIITSRKAIFDKVEKEIFLIEDSRNTIVTLDLRNESYDYETRDKFLERCLEFHKVSWRMNLELLFFVKLRLKNYLPTMLNIWNFAQSYFKDPDENKLLEIIKEHSVSTPIWFASQILDNKPEVMYLLSFPLISQWNETEFVRKQYQKLTKDTTEEDIHTFDKIRSKFTYQVNLGKYVTFSHPSYVESLPYILEPNKIPRRVEKLGEIRFKQNFIKVLFKMVEQEYVDENVAHIIVENYTSLPNTVHELLFKLAENHFAVESVCNAIVENYTSLPNTVHELLFKLAENDRKAMWVGRAIFHNFESIPLNPRENLLFKLTENRKADGFVSITLSYYFNDFSQSTRESLLFKLMKNNNSAHYIASIIVKNYTSLPNTVHELLFKLAENFSTVDSVAAAMEYCPKVPLEIEEKIKIIITNTIINHSM